ncbi:hypothetical protein [Sabulicella glaciei]|uniref:Uncharacterized protein n=1 Tax=Sabulicella glaciei TaxID=2984948 RepID=A0ABT3NZ37_9PROT|nr:hypothetical protein [Roseococcus sp. MDT2-1-1]MCW8087420.1 hypothetical protein [Roseococcus sp. MDT2-1-1]
MTESTTTRRQPRARCAALTLAVLLGGSLAAGSAAAQDRGPRNERHDWGFASPNSGGHGSPGYDRGSDGGAQGQDRDLDSMARDAFDRGYRAGREQERRNFQSGPGWNNAAQRQAYQLLEHAAADLRRALMLMHRDPSLPRNNTALVEATQALIQLQNAMTWLPSQRSENLRPDGGGFGPGDQVGPARAQGGWRG